MDSLRFIDCCLTTGAQHELSATRERATVAEIAHSMGVAAIAAGLVRHALAREYSPKFGNARLVEELSAHSNLFPVATIAPLMFTSDSGRDDETAIRSYLSDARYRGAAVFPSAKYQNFSIADWCSSPIMRVLESMRMPLFVELTEIGAESLAYLLMAHSSLPVVVTGVYYAADRTLFPLLDRHDNLYLVSTIDRQYMGLEDYSKRFGAHRLLFGSNYPRSSVGASVASVQLSGLSHSEKEQIASGTIETLIGGIRYDN